MLRRSLSLAAWACVALLLLAWLRGRRSRSRLPGCDVAARNASLVTEVLLDPLFVSLCTKTPVREARGGCFEVGGSTVCLPTFLVVGFTKAGTTAFFQYVAQHPLVHASRIKEPGFLGARAESADREAARAERQAKARVVVFKAAAVSGELRSPSRRQKSLAWYVELFGRCARCERGEATPSYAWRDHAPVAAAQARLLLGATASLVMLVRRHRRALSPSSSVARCPLAAAARTLSQPPARARRRRAGARAAGARRVALPLLSAQAVR